MGEPTTLFDKLWDLHEITCTEDGRSLLFVDRHLLHDGSFHAFRQLRDRGLEVRHPELAMATADHYVPTSPGPLAEIADPTAQRVLRELGRNVEDFGIRGYLMGDSRRGIAHVVGPEEGFTIPGSTVVCGDSHTATHGAFGALAFGIGATEVAHVLATQCVWQTRPRAMRIIVNGTLPPGAGAKDLALAVLSQIGSDGASGHALEWMGPTIETLSMAGRTTLCNLSVEAGAKTALIAADERTIGAIEGRALAPTGALWEDARAFWQQLVSDEDAPFDRTVEIDASAVTSMVTWGTRPWQAIPITGSVPDPAGAPDPERADEMAVALKYMGFEPGQSMTDIGVDQVFIGSCANGQLEDLWEAATVVASLGGKAQVPTLVSAGSTRVKRMAEEAGLADIFIRAGFTWGESGCSMCVGMNGDTVGPGRRCVATTNRNFEGRQGPRARTHLASPAIAAAAAMSGHLGQIPPSVRGEL